MLCSEIMKLDVECVSPKTSLREAARAMRDRNIGFLPVCDEERRSIGVVTDRDIAVRAIAEGCGDSTPVETIMTREVVSCRPEDELRHAHELMARHRKSRIVCVDRRGRVKGVISLSDLADLDELEGGSTLREVSAREHRRGREAEWMLSI